MVEKFNQILEIIAKERGTFMLFAIMKMDDFVDKWSVIISASWLKENDFESFNYILKRMKGALNEEENNSIARIGIFDKHHHLIESLLQYKRGSIIKDQKVNGNLIHLAYILESNKETAEESERNLATKTSI